MSNLPLSANMDVDETAIDEGLYSRQLYVLGHEAKDLVLAGVKSVTVYDPEPVKIEDLSSQTPCRSPRLAKLNVYVLVRNLGGQAGQEITVDLVRGFQVVVVCNAPYAKQLEINNWTHQNNVPFIATETRGLFGSVFNDFGAKFTCVDPTGEQPLSGMIVSIDKKSLRESLQSPEFFITDFAKFDRPSTLHAGFQALSEFHAQHKWFPKPRNAHDANAVVAIAKKFDADADEKIVTQLAFQATGDLSPVIAVIGVFVAQEALKACSAKFHPMQQHMYFDSLELLPNVLLSEAECQPTGSHYNGQVSVFGKTFQDKISNHCQFLVGSGAISCEMLKNWNMMGLASGPKGAIQVTDLDTIEKSNLNRQFLF
ncbi:MAG: ubiquitin-activating enzyme E1, isoform CRA_b, partial [Lentinula lateritia]